MYANQLINEAEVQKTWAPIIEESTGITDKSKLTWMSKYCHYHNLNESVYNTVHLNPNMNVQSMGNATLPGNPGSLNAFPAQATGSGDRPFSLLPLAMQVAAQTVGLDLVPVVPMQGPMGVLTYLDFVYGGGRPNGAPASTTAAGLTPGPGVNAGAPDVIGSPLLIKCRAIPLVVAAGTDGFAVNDVIYAASAACVAGLGTATYELTYVGRSRIDGFQIFRVRAFNGASLANGFPSLTNVYTQGGENAGEPIYSAISDGLNFYGNAAVAGTTPFPVRAVGAMPVAGAAGLVAQGAFRAAGAGGVGLGYVKALEDHIAGFSGNAFQPANNPATGGPAFTNQNINGTDPYQRGVGESTVDNVMGLSLFNKSIAAETFQVAAAVTREQVQDLKQFGVDAVAQVETVLTNELTQSINSMILKEIDTLGALNVTNGATDLSLSVGVLANSYNGSNDQSRRILTLILSAANLIANRGRRGAGNFAVVSGQVASLIQSVAGYQAAPIANTVNQNAGGIYPVGSVAGVNVYVDPNKAWDDMTVTIGRKGDGNGAGLVFMPYLMAESVQTIAEGTMAPKVAVKSRFALVRAGHNPETQYVKLTVSGHSA